MGLMDTITDAVKLAQKLDNIELNNTILRLQAQIMDLLTENQSLKDQLREVQGRLQGRQSVVYDKEVGAYFAPQSAGERDGPFCSKCFDEHGRLMRLKEYGNGFSGCPSCNTSIRYGHDRTPPPRRREVDY